jgi:enoyl-CoA hydratase/carnithine racemase
MLDISDDKIAVITLVRPPVNALNGDLVRKLLPRSKVPPKLARW